MMIIGIDPGKSGALAALTDNGHLIEVFDMPVVGTTISGALLDEWIHNWVDPLAPTNVVAVIEDVHAMPKQGVSTMFAFGRALGLVEGVVQGNGIPLHYVSPARWKRDMRLGRDKGASRQRAIELWPSSAPAFRRVKDDGRAEAALIAEWWRTFGAGAVAA
jgi:crossover junction endodeoxyribonuclease RuvC